MGAVITYGAYMPKRQNIMATSLQVAVIDTLVAVFAGLIIFPAVFAFGVNPSEGPQLVFVVLPAIFEKMTFPWFSSIMFFGLLCVAAITSTISLMEVAVAFLTDATEKRKHPLNRPKAVLIVSAIVLALVVLDARFEGVFMWSDMLTANILMPANALAMALFIGWHLNKNDVRRDLGKQSGWQYKVSTAFIPIVRYIVPLAILAIFLNGLGLL